MSNLKDIQMNVVILREAVIRNRDQHLKDVAEAKVDRRKSISTEFRKELKNIKNSEDYQPEDNFDFPKIVDHSKDYARAISMLQDTIADTIEISEHQYDRLVLDNWDWTEGFKFSNEVYKL